MAFPTTHPALAAALAQRGYTDPTEVQAAVLREAAAERDLLVSAQTGSGKTVAYGLAFAPTLLGDNPQMPATRHPLALVIAPTRELALQVHAELAWLYAETGARIIACVGGMDTRREARALAAGCHMVAGTPGRLCDHITRGALNLSECEVVVLDEADEMLDLGFKEELDFILAAARPSRRTLLFSATISREIAALARNIQQDALRIDTLPRNQPHADIAYRAVLVAGQETEAALVNLLRLHGARALVFGATREGVRHLHAALLARGFNAVALSGELTQNERNSALAALRENRAQVCIATDVAARGLDLPELDLVIHADLPTNKETLLHRSGRTGRAGRKGVCLLLVPASKRRRAEQLLTAANITAVWEHPPTPAEIQARDQARLLDDPALTQAPDEAELALARKLLERQGPEAIAAALIRLTQARLPAPAEVTILPPAPAAAKFTRQAGPAAWFRANVGRKQNADPKWLIPLICRQGGVTKADIGAIRIFDRETKFEILGDATAFAAAIAQAGEEVRLEAAAAPGMKREAEYTPRPPRKPDFLARPERPPGAKPNEQERRRKNKVLKTIR